MPKGEDGWGILPCDGGLNLGFSSSNRSSSIWDSRLLSTAIICITGRLSDLGAASRVSTYHLSGKAGWVAGCAALLRGSFPPSSVVVFNNNNTIYWYICLSSASPHLNGWILKAWAHAVSEVLANQADGGPCRPKVEEMMRYRGGNHHSLALGFKATVARS